MAKGYTEWTVHEHGPIEELESNLWRVEAKLPKSEIVRRVMTVAKLRDGRLVIHNAIALDGASMKRLDDWGRPGFLIVPNGFHRLDARPFKDRYPEAAVCCPRAARKAVSAVVPVDLTFDEFEGDDTVSIDCIDGVGDREGVLVVRHGDAATLVFNDLIFNMPHRAGFAGFVLRHLTASSGGPRVSRLASMLFVKNKARFASELMRLAATPGLRRIVVSHYDVVDQDAPGALRGIAAALQG